MIFASSILCILPFLGPAMTAPPPKLDPKVLQGWVDDGKPVAQHARLKDYVGSWTTHQTDWLPDGKVWNEADGTATCHLIMDGRFLREDYATTLDGHPFHGLGLLGFDRQKQIYTFVWLDDLGTSITSLGGSFDGTGRVLTLLGGLPPGVVGQAATATWRVTDTWQDANHHVVVWWGKGSDGLPAKFSQIRYARNP
jgi:hypothetical protein